MLRKMVPHCAEPRNDRVRICGRGWIVGIAEASDRGSSRGRDCEFPFGSVAAEYTAGAGFVTFSLRVVSNSPDTGTPAAPFPSQAI